MYATLLTSIDNGILTITINRPDKMNALNQQVFADLNHVLENEVIKPEVRSVILTGAGPKAFVAGADISEFSSLDQQAATSLSISGQDTFFKIENNAKPIVAAVNGFALGGGCELAMACHFRIASSNAKFGQPEVNLGLVPGYGGTQRLVQLIGKGKALELLMSAQMLSAADALSWGLVNYVVEPEALLPKAIEILTLINTKAPLAVAGCITAANAAMDESKNGYLLEANLFGAAFNTADRIEGTTAFLEKRAAKFEGK
ncbi:MAG: enoyl-CoA hydratase/isomerase family protein [Chitinophagaceae bacterium]|uniref:enoyl-CoA hydratase/isomerase family protein n=1 Tax=unclassified Paraflavitalea TaxID=2798305 RepID=UPI003D347406|nr:enoyl-CoA hydratase/isomerase family protein [Chitinophagaceae bacterium]